MMNHDGDGNGEVDANLACVACVASLGCESFGRFLLLACCWPLAVEGC